MTTVSPYARNALNDPLSVWGLARWGTGDMTIVQAANDDTGQPKRVARTDLEMRLAALGGRRVLMEAAESGIVDVGLRADGFHVETESEAVPNEGSTTGVASRLRLALEGSRAFRMEGGGTMTPGLEVGLHHDGGDAETGTDVDLGGRVTWTDPETGLSVEARARGMVAHEDSNYKERGLAPGQEFEPGQRQEGEFGYGLGLFGDRFTGAPNVGFGLADTSRDCRIGWRLTWAVTGGPGFEVNLDATHHEADNANEPPEQGRMLRGAIRW